jgi:trigger factor
MLNVQTEHLENHTARLTVEIEPERLDKALRDAARRIAKKGRIPGFRPGKAPMSVVINLYGREYVLGEALDKLGNELYREALDSAEIDPYAPGNLEDVDEDGHKLVFIVPKRPTVDLADYREIRLPYEVEEITDKMVDDAMENLLEGQAILEPVERPLQMGDQVTFEHFEVVLLTSETDEEKAEDTTETDESDAADDEPADDESADDEEPDNELTDEDEEEVLFHRHDYDLVLREDAERDLFPGFSENLVGLSASDEKTFTLDVPDDYGNEIVAGHTLRCDVVVKQVQARTVPEWTDALAARISEGEQETILELRIDVRKQLEERAAQIADSELANAALEKLVEGATIQYPEEVVQDYLSDILEDLDRNMRQQGLTLQDYMKITGRSEEDLREEYRERAVWRVERSLTLGELVRKEELDVSDDEITAEIDRMVEALGGEQASQFRQFLMMDQSRRDVSSRLVTDRAMARLVAIAKGEEPPTGPDTDADREAAPVEAEPETGESVAEVAAADVTVETEPSEE